MSFARQRIAVAISLAVVASFQPAQARGDIEYKPSLNQFYDAAIPTDGGPLLPPPYPAHITQQATSHNGLQVAKVLEPALMDLVSSGFWDAEELKDLQKVDVQGRVVVIDCVTLWCTNFFTESIGDVDYSLSALKERFDLFTQQDAHFIFVTNELGLGGISENDLQRRFTDLIGWANQYIASKADEVVLMVSGIAMKVKNPTTPNP